MKMGGGSVSAQGRFSAGAGGAKSPGLRYVGGFDIAGLALDEDDGEPFPSWKSVGADKLTATPAPPAAPVGASPPAQAQPADDPFPVRIQRVRFQNGKLDFTDLSLQPQFGAKIHELNGVVTGLSSNRDSRSQIE